MKSTLAEPEFMNITGPDGEIYIGGSQDWFDKRWHRIAGCGPVAASNLMWYTLRMHGEKSRYEALMREMYSFMTPGMHGVNKSELFTNAVLRYCAEAGLQINLNVLEIPKAASSRPDIDVVYEFLSKALRSDTPVAFLNLSNGTVRNLEKWHWVTIIALDEACGLVEVSDYGKKLVIDISEWLKTTRLGGCFVSVLQSVV